MPMPERVTIVEVGPRDGLQNEAARIPTGVKVGFIDRLTAAGLPVVEATSFVHPRAVPQLADADEVYPAISRAPGVRYPVLVPTPRGLERAIAAGADEVAVVIGATDEFNRANLNRTVEGALADAASVIARARERGMRVRGYVSVAFGCPYAGPVDPSTTAAVAARLLDLGCDEISLGDTIGAATPGDVQRVLDAVLPLVGAERVGLHAHDTRGQALADVYAALERGVSIIDSSAGGLGGCPFAGPGAVGNLATEDLVYFLDGLGIEHGVSLEGVMAASAFIGGHLGHGLRSPTFLAGGRPRTRALPGTELAPRV
ncbi:MAG TPA: hydroxymethylglutaryl-CoA lyase [Candidatus Limnocylindrales bacterium]|jgi:hydroxymethylglutaryl-CoA lyase